MSATEEIAALQKALVSAKNELVLVRSERDLLKERLNKFMRKIFAAKSEVIETENFLIITNIESPWAIS